MSITWTTLNHVKHQPRSQDFPPERGGTVDGKYPGNEVGEAHIPYKPVEPSEPGERGGQSQPWEQLNENQVNNKNEPGEPSE